MIKEGVSGDEEKVNDSFSAKTMAVLAVLSLVSLVPWELSREEPIVDLRLFANRQFALSALALLAVGTFIFSTIQILPQLLHWSIREDDPGFLPFLVVMHLGTAMYSTWRCPS